MGRREYLGYGLWLAGILMLFFALTFDNLTGGPREHVHSDLPGYNCGVESVCYLAAYYGLGGGSKSVRALGDQYLDNKGVISLAALKLMCEAAGFKVPRLLHVDPKGFEDLKPPFIMHMLPDGRGSGHFKVCVGQDRSLLLTVDLTRNPPIENMLKPGFWKEFSGYVLMP